MVVELPDGRRLALGQLAHGRVMEVAMWSGLGPPGPQTQRLLVGAEDGAGAPAPQRGMLVVARLEGGATVLGRVAAVDGRSVEIAVASEQATVAVRRDDVVGRVVVIVPYLGWCS